MKISQMIRREDFYRINAETLEKYYGKSASKATTLCVYPHLNAIVRRNPSRAVKKYLYREYDVSGAFIYRLAVRLYAAAALCTFGLLCAKRIKVFADVSKDTLIYPCNKKYRIFDFEKNEVTAICKEGFDKSTIRREISFRKENAALPFMNPVKSETDFSYKEPIIDGYPLARLHDEEKKAHFKENAISLWREQFGIFDKKEAVADYARELSEKVQKLTEMCIDSGRNVDVRLISSLESSVMSGSGTGKEVTVCLSHGDMQEGNIWIENKTDKIYIIDYETTDMRSRQYDEAVLYGGIRSDEGLLGYADSEELGNIVLLEDVIYRLTELLRLPENCTADDFNAFLKKAERIFVK